MAFWEPFFHGNTPIDLAHLEPFDFVCPTPAGIDRKIHVTFTSHVFTRDWEPGDSTAGIFFDSRIFCPKRYAESAELPLIIRGLPTSRVYQTWEKRNYVYLAVQDPHPCGDYHMFFEVKKGSSKKKKRIDLVIESAYRNDQSAYAPPARPNAIRFPVLVENIINEREIKFAPR